MMFEDRSSFAQLIVSQLRGENSLWHSTGIEQLSSILISGALLPSNSVGVKSVCTGSRSYKRNLISLFDFDFADYEKIFSQGKNWRHVILGYRHDRDSSVIIEICKDSLDSRKLEPPYTAEEFNDANPDSKLLLIPFVEAWYSDPIPVSAFKSYRLTRKKEEEFVTVDVGANAEPLIRSIFQKWHEEEEMSDLAYLKNGGIDIRGIKEGIKRQAKKAGGGVDGGDKS